MSKSDSEAEIKRLIDLGYAREDIQVLPDGQLFILPHDEMKSSALAVAKATAPARLERMLALRKELEEANEIDTDEYTDLQIEIDETRKLID